MQTINQFASRSNINVDYCWRYKKSAWLGWSQEKRNDFKAFHFPMMLSTNRSVPTGSVDPLFHPFCHQINAMHFSTDGCFAFPIRY